MSYSKRISEGYWMVDHRASPGLPADFYQKMGSDIPVATEGKMVEAATMTCSHCTMTVVVNPDRKRARAYCRACDHYVCDVCALRATMPDYVHTPFQKKVDELVDHSYHQTFELSPLLKG